MFQRKFIKQFCSKFSALNYKDPIKSLAPFSLATKVDLGDQEMIFVSGTLGIDYKTGKLVGKDIESQTKQVM
jgi:enamine deaminase RidA (YjgF/YER057c/UK114 family)